MIGGDAVGSCTKIWYNFAYVLKGVLWSQCCEQIMIQAILGCMSKFEQEPDNGTVLWEEWLDTTFKISTWILLPKCHCGCAAMQLDWNSHYIHLSNMHHHSSILSWSYCSPSPARVKLKRLSPYAKSYANLQSMKVKDTRVSKMWSPSFPLILLSRIFFFFFFFRVTPAAYGCSQARVELELQLLA